ncbi:hypothetical protein S101258_00450 [Lactiplantibacillus plantarum subsp. plantarum]|uniref:Uncharacterized protein n=1 Tax=Lactiplantibacillus plantarum subsp. plantarum TaxID=337330 RepID=A0A2S3U952_LACPN|nr:hypothetical protein S101258_00450 [Lactiplantibacillus plantarum subsp. plantarum]
MDYNYQQAMIQMGIPISVYESEDFFKINRVMLANHVKSGHKTHLLHYAVQACQLVVLSKRRKGENNGNNFRLSVQI